MKNSIIKCNHPSLAKSSRFYDAIFHLLLVSNKFIYEFVGDKQQMKNSIIKCNHPSLAKSSRPVHNLLIGLKSALSGHMQQDLSATTSASSGHMQQDLSLSLHQHHQGTCNRTCHYHYHIIRAHATGLVTTTITTSASSGHMQQDLSLPLHQHHQGTCNWTCLSLHQHYQGTCNRTCHYHYISIIRAHATGLVRMSLPLHQHHQGTCNRTCHYHYISIIRAHATGLVTTTTSASSGHMQLDLSLPLHQPRSHIKSNYLNYVFKSD